MSTESAESHQQAGCQFTAVFLVLVIHALAWWGSLLPQLFALECGIGLFLLCIVPAFSKAAREIDEALDFRSPTSDNHNQNERMHDENVNNPTA